MRIDLSTDDGMRQAFREIAEWSESATAASNTGDGAVVILEPQRQEGRRASHWKRRSAAAAAVALVVAGITISSRQTADVAPAASGEWTVMAPSPLEPRFEPVTLWTGDELLVWGGHDVAGVEYTDGAAYDPDTDRWRPIADFPFDYWIREGSPVDADTAWWSTHLAPGAWAGDRAIFVVGNPVEPWAWDLVSYDPADDEWSIVDSARFDQRPNDSLVLREGAATVDSPMALAWTGEAVVVFGWHSAQGELGWATVDPTTGSWTEFSGIPGSGEFADSGWPDSVVVGRHLMWVRQRLFRDSDEPLGYALDLTTKEVATIGVPRGLVGGGVLADLASDGTIVGLALSDDGKLDRVAARLDPATGRWNTLPSPTSGPTDEDAFAELGSVGVGTVLIGGFDQDGRQGGLRSTTASLALGADADRWQSLPDAPIDLARIDHTMVWTGEKLLVWGGATVPDGESRATLALGDGAAYRVDD